jgi:hypothetical protein
VRGFQAAEIPALHRAREAAPDGDAGDVHLLARDEVRGEDLVADFQQIFLVDAEFGDLALGFD